LLVFGREGCRHAQSFEELGTDLISTQATQRTTHLLSMVEELNATGPKYVKGRFALSVKLVAEKKKLSFQLKTRIPCGK